jgi:hypothetical protein
VRRHVPLALAAAAVAWVVVANRLPAASIRAADWSRPLRVETHGLTAYYPRAWHAAVEGTTMVISSEHIWIWITRYRPARSGEFPPRPEHFELEDANRGFQSCGFGFDGWNLTYRDHGQVVQAVVRVDPGAPKSDATRVLDRIIALP